MSTFRVFTNVRSEWTRGNPKHGLPSVLQAVLVLQLGMERAKIVNQRPGTLDEVVSGSKNTKYKNMKKWHNNQPDTDSFIKQYLYVIIYHVEHYSCFHISLSYQTLSFVITLAADYCFCYCCACCTKNVILLKNRFLFIKLITMNECCPGTALSFLLCFVFYVCLSYTSCDISVNL